MLENHVLIKPLCNGIKRMKHTVSPGATVINYNWVRVQQVWIYTLKIIVSAMQSTDTFNTEKYRRNGVREPRIISLRLQIWLVFFRVTTQVYLPESGTSTLRYRQSSLWLLRKGKSLLSWASLPLGIHFRASSSSVKFELISCEGLNDKPEGKTWGHTGGYSSFIFTPDQGAPLTGGIKRKDPNGGLAYGMPRKC